MDLVSMVGLMVLMWRLCGNLYVVVCMKFFILVFMVVVLVFWVMGFCLMMLVVSVIELLLFR